ncbi:MAG: CPBP family intramembrane metalloprotease [Bacteroidia bacterium]|nr:CPBP family intramembrane metalloprotease [Bacteroidia bacterium]
MITRKAGIFLLLAFGMSWLISLPLFIFDLKMGGFAGMAVGMLYMLMPMTAALIVQKVIYKGNLSNYGLNFKPNWWFAVAWVGPVVLALAAFGISLLFPGIHFSAGMDYIFDMYSGILSVEQIEKMEEAVDKIPSGVMFGMSVFSGLMAGVSINAIFAFGEELGWRGLFQWEMRQFGFWRSNLLIGAVWGLWHAPLVIKGLNYPDHPYLGILMMVAWCTLLGPVMGYLRIKTRSVIAVSVLHGSLNGTAGIGLLFLSGGNDLLVGVTGLAGFLVLGVLNLLIFLLDRDGLELHGAGVLEPLPTGGPGVLRAAEPLP